MYEFLVITIFRMLKIEYLYKKLYMSKLFDDMSQLFKVMSFFFFVGMNEYGDEN